MRRSSASGMTLIEVVAGLALMGSLLTVVLVSSSQHLRQLKAAEQKRASVRMLDDFLAGWSIGNFGRDAVADAVLRSGLPATGSFGTHGRGDRSDAMKDAYRVHLRAIVSPVFAEADLVRLTVSIPDSSGGRINTAWAEVLVPR